MNGPYEFEDMEDYLEGRMSESDRKAFEWALQSDTELANRLEALRNEAQVNRLLREEYLFEQFAAWEKENASAERTTNRGITGMMVTYRRWIVPAGIAASVVGLICLGLIFHWFGSPGPQLVMTQAQPEAPLDTSRGPGRTSPPADATAPAPDSAAGRIAQQPDDAGQEAGYYAGLADSAYIDEDFKQALMGADDTANHSSRYLKAVQLYTAGQYGEALKLLEKPEQNQLEEYLYLRGYTYYHLHRYDKAEADFRVFRNFPVSDRKLDAQWCEVFCMLKQMPASRKRLNSLLTGLQSNPGIYSERATALQKALNRK